MLWRTLNTRSGIDVNEIVETSEALQKGDEKEVHQAVLENIMTHAKRLVTCPI